MYGNRDASTIDADTPDLQPDPTEHRDQDTLSAEERGRLRTATMQVRRAAEALVPGIAEVDARLTGTPEGPGGLVVVQAPGMPPVGTAIEADATALTGDGPVLTEAEVNEKATDVVAQAAVLARQAGPDPDGMPAN